MKNLVFIIVAVVMAASVIGSAYALSGVNLSGVNGTSLFADQHLRVNLSSLQIKHVELSK